MTDLSENIKQAVPFFRVNDMPSSLKFYVDGLGFELANHWEHEGRLRWCWLQSGGAAIMLQEADLKLSQKAAREERPGLGVSICLMCQDALSVFNSSRQKGLHPEQPFVGNGLWVVAFNDPDGYRIEFESPTDVAEGTRYES